MMWWALWCAAMVAGSAFAVAAPAPDSLAPLDLVQIDPSTVDDENLGYAVQTMGGHYAAGAPWLYLLADMPRDSQVSEKEMSKRSRSLIVVNPAVDLLQRNALINHISRVAHDNRNFLDQVGKRAHWSNADAY